MGLILDGFEVKGAWRGLCPGLPRPQGPVAHLLGEVAAGGTNDCSCSHPLSLCHTPPPRLSPPKPLLSGPLVPVPFTLTRPRGTQASHLCVSLILETCLWELLGLVLLPGNPEQPGKHPLSSAPAPACDLIPAQKEE